jgi:hypothetical protein
MILLGLISRWHIPILFRYSTLETNCRNISSLDRSGRGTPLSVSCLRVSPSARCMTRLVQLNDSKRSRALTMLGWLTYCRSMYSFLMMLLTCSSFVRTSLTAKGRAWNPLMSASVIWARSLHGLTMPNDPYTIQYMMSRKATYCSESNVIVNNILLLKRRLISEFHHKLYFLVKGRCSHLHVTQPWWWFVRWRVSILAAVVLLKHEVSVVLTASRVIRIGRSAEGILRLSSRHEDQSFCCRQFGLAGNSMWTYTGLFFGSGGRCRGFGFGVTSCVGITINYIFVFLWKTSSVKHFLIKIQT